MSKLGYGLALIAAFGITACASYGGERDSSGESISIPYDPYDFAPDDLLAEAQRHCEAYGLRAVYVDETIDPQSVRWRYRHFDCV
ncbi:MAG: hypothetical protein GXP04_00335 [Alphaproteobacteria bacterium]|nr:hypothetical protein [Marinicaulis sp.]NOX93575.1 hypothetical protein [Alphaproteobacteria bacterium]